MIGFDYNRRQIVKATNVCKKLVVKQKLNCTEQETVAVEHPGTTVPTTRCYMCSSSRSACLMFMLIEVSDRLPVGDSISHEPGNRRCTFVSFRLNI